MSRHTLEDGKTPDERITPDQYDQWMPELAPPPKLVGAWYCRKLGERTPENFDTQYRPRYIEYLAEKTDLVKNLGELAISTTITVLCIEPTEESSMCHRTILLEYCQSLVPGLEIEKG